MLDILPTPMHNEEDTRHISTKRISAGKCAEAADRILFAMAFW